MLSVESLYSWLVVLLIHSEIIFCLEGGGPKDEGSMYKINKPLISKNRRAVMKAVVSCFEI